MQDNILKRVVIEPTRGDNILDLVLTNNENMISEVDVGASLAVVITGRSGLIWNGK